MDVHPTKNVSIGIDPYPYGKSDQNGWGYPQKNLRISSPMATNLASPNFGTVRAKWYVGSVEKNISR